MWQILGAAALALAVSLGAPDAPAQADGIIQGGSPSASGGEVQGGGSPAADGEVPIIVQGGN
jgi:hypothetical protein